MGEVFDEARAKIDLDRDRLKFERQKLALDVTLKRREIGAQKKEAIKALLANPLALAVVGGFITLMTSTLTATYTASQNQIAESKRAEYARLAAHDTLQADLIKKFVEGPSPSVVRDNLKFLVEVGLLPTYAVEIRSYLEKNPGSAPQLNPAPLLGSRDDAVPLEGLKEPSLYATGRSIGRLVAVDGSSFCTAFLVQPDLVGNAGRCVEAARPQMKFAIGDLTRDAKLHARKVTENGAHYSLYQLSQALPDTIPVLRLSEKPPALGDRLSIVMFRDSSPLMAATADCRVTAIHDETFEHTCFTGPGSGGAPVVLFGSQTVVGISVRNTLVGGWATRSDLVRRELRR